MIQNDEAATTAESAQKIVVVKIGSSSVTTRDGDVDRMVMRKIAAEVAEEWAEGHRIVLVTSGSIAAGWTALAGGVEQPSDLGTLQAVATIGQHRLMQAWSGAFETVSLLVGQVLLAPLDFIHRSQYLHARQTIGRLIELGVVPIINENDAVADEEIRFGDNDRLAALVAHMVNADELLLLTDTAGLYTGDPKDTIGASLIEEVVEVDQALEAVAGGPGTSVGSGGMASKLAAARIAAWSGIQVVIADAGKESVLHDAMNGSPNVGTRFRARERQLSARKLWIAFAVGSSGSIQVDAGARDALVSLGRSLLAAGITDVRGDFGADAAVEIIGPNGDVFAKGLVRHTSELVAQWAGRRSGDLPDEIDAEIVHRDDLVILI